MAYFFLFKDTCNLLIILYYFLVIPNKVSPCLRLLFFLLLFTLKWHWSFTKSPTHLKPLRYSNLAKGLSQTQRVRSRLTQSLNTAPNECLMAVCITYLMNDKEVLILVSTGESKYRADHYITWNMIYSSQITTITPEPFALMTDCKRLQTSQHYLLYV